MWSDNTRIAHNAFFLYVRMFFILIVNLYTVRVIWHTLGEDDFGIYSVVGGIVTMFAFLNNGMVSSSQRFISYEIGTGNFEQLQKVFNIASIVHLLIAIVVVLVGETIGLWFVNSKLNIPDDRDFAMNIVYQCSLFSLFFTIISVPYNSCIVAHEHMNVYGYLGILESFLKLSIVFLLDFIKGDKLIVYGILILSVTILMRILYTVYCKMNFKECKNNKQKNDYGIMKQMFSFAGWSFIGNMGITFKDQGLNVILNMFFNVAINASKAISSQVSGATSAFVGYFQMALNPQITKRYASGNIGDMLTLIFRGCKYSFILMAIIVIPLFSLTELVLRLWLGEAQSLTIGFVRISLITCLVESLVGPITTALQATGKIKNFQIIIATIAIINLPIAWIWLKMNLNPYSVFFIALITSFMALIARIYLLHKLVKFSFKEFLRIVLFKNFPTVLLYGTITYFISVYLRDNDYALILINIIGVAIFLFLTYFLLLDRKEREFLSKLILRR